jgi:hypothetical protein
MTTHEAVHGEELLAHDCAPSCDERTREVARTGRRALLAGPIVLASLIAGEDGEPKPARPRPASCAGPLTA